MASVTGIINVALRQLGATRITSLTDGSKNANVANDIFEPVRDSFLRSHTWNFATSRVQLAQLSTDPAFGFDNAFQLPADWLRTVSVHDNDAGVGVVPYRIEGDQLHADVEEIYLRYIKKVTDPNAMTPDFREALSYILAERMAIPVAESNTLRELMREGAERYSRLARSADAVEDYPEDFPAGSWVEDRNR